MRKRGISGSAAVAGLIDSTGRMRDVVVLRASQPEFGEAAAESLRGWEFLPARVDCVTVDLRLDVTVQYAIGR
jgi:TonB family protein